jgi:general secretion pathway protein G
MTAQHRLAIRAPSHYCVFVKILLRNPRHHGGYTLMEMIMVLAIIALLLGTGAYLMSDVLGDGNKIKVKSDIQTLHANLIRYKTNGDCYPSEEQGLDALVNEPVGDPQPTSWKNYLQASVLIDPWGRPYQYRYPGKHNPGSYDIFTLGIDGLEGTADDVGNWDPKAAK